MNNFKPDFSRALPLDFFNRNPENVARELLGQAFVISTEDGYLASEITETEAYLAKGDLSCHSSKGATKKNKAMFAGAGTFYVYLIYGVHYCANVVTEPEGVASAVLIRAARPLIGIEQMIERRKKNKIKDLARGPGNFCKAHGITTEDNFKKLNSKDLFIQGFSDLSPSDIATSGRIGITKSTELELRFYIKNSEYVSGR